MFTCANKNSEWYIWANEQRNLTKDSKKVKHEYVYVERKQKSVCFNITLYPIIGGLLYTSDLLADLI